MTKARFLRKHAHRLTSPEDRATISQLPHMTLGKARVKAAKKTARNMRDEATYKGSSRIPMQSTSAMQAGNDYTRQLSPRDGAVYMGGTGKTFLRKGVR